MHSLSKLQDVQLVKQDWTVLPCSFPYQEFYWVSQYGFLKRYGELCSVNPPQLNKGVGVLLFSSMYNSFVIVLFPFEGQPAQLSPTCLLLAHSFPFLPPEKFPESLLNC
eukprot:TRINITY_DN12850_c0_g1_i1.p1 TRINITY_DN12850_c0_g1~~TRINITY_DN12850_c0_g1_i1.p1  ORF type:complete len:109 (+),score=5.47 TRINITY_DN12850_c0_g1_i1:366-692(+)